MCSDIAIVGAGLAGSLLAYVLQPKFQIDLYDANTHRAANSAAGMLSPYTELDRADSWITPIGLQSIEFWRKFSEINNNIYFKKNGTLITAHPQYKGLLEFNQSKIFMKSGFKTTNNFYPDEANIDAQQVIQKLQTDIKIQRIDNIKKLAKQYAYVFDCRGMGAKNYFEDLRGIRSEVIWLHSKEVTFNYSVRVLHPRYRIYIVPRPHNIFIVGATEIESEDYSPISLTSVMEILSLTYSFNKHFSEARVLKTLTGVRPRLTDDKPRISKKGNIIAFNGLYRHGFLLAPALIQDIYRFMTNESLHHTQFWEFDDDQNYFQQQNYAATKTNTA